MNRPLFPYPNSRDVEVSNPFRGERDHREHTAKRCWNAVPYDFRNRYIVIILAAVKLFRRRERKIGTGADVLAYVKVVPVAPFDAYGSSLSKKKFRRRGA